jgi:hypothetical protein
MCPLSCKANDKSLGPKTMLNLQGIYIWTIKLVMNKINVTLRSFMYGGLAK